MRLKWWTLAALLLAGVQAVGAEGAGTLVRIDSGPIVGKFQLNTSVHAFLGIPFAEYMTDLEAECERRADRERVPAKPPATTSRALIK